MTTTPTSGAAIQRYKIGYREDEWGQRSSTPGGIPDASGPWVRYADHVTALAGQAKAAQAVVPSGWNLVPTEPTQAMLDAVVTSMDDFLLGKEAEKQYCEDWAAMLAATPPAPVLWLSPEQFANFVDTDEAEFGKYIPARKTSAGKFTMPLFAARAPADSVTAPAGGVDDAVDAIALARYKVVPAHESMFHRFAVVAGDGKRQLYIGREIECANMARKFAGAFLDGAFYQANIAPTPPAQAADSVQEDAADPLQGAANWLAEAHGQFSPVVLSGCLMIGYNRAKRLHDAALAARKRGASQ